MTARVIPGPLDTESVRNAVLADECGAVVLFHGIVRDHDAGKTVRSLEYRAHPEAEGFLARCLETERARHGLRLAAAHRFGDLRIGDVALVAAASAPHRAAAFDALEALVERIKHEVPIWKRQWFTDGASEWVGL